MPSSGQLWHIFHVLNCRHTRDPKNKFVVIVHIDGDALGCLINSRVSNWIQKRPWMHICEATVAGLTYPGINHDSFADCQALYPFFDRELHDDRGLLRPQEKVAILTAIAKCPTIEEKYRKAILLREKWPPDPAE